MSRLERLAAVIAKPCDELAVELGVRPIVAMKAQLRAAERLLPFVRAN